jgi:hypothetical protein
MRAALVAALIATGFALPSRADAVEISPNESNDGVILRDREVRDDRTGRRPFSHDHNGRRALVEPKSPCTYNGLLLECDIPQPATPLGTVVTPGLARQAVASIPLPGLTLHVQPDGETLVNVPTIFWVDPQPFETSIDLLGHEIEVEATPESFTWVHGDGTMQTTDDPGKPYPRDDITHRYWQPAELQARVDTTYSVRFSIDGDGWTDLGEALIAAGPATIIDVHEAAPVLVR